MEQGGAHGVPKLKDFDNKVRTLVELILQMIRGTCSNLVPQLNFSFLKPATMTNYCCGKGQRLLLLLLISCFTL
ncbi:MAG TPA: hypothetical protein PKE63_14090, partial [Lacibacter sp.]|nr:hypothetical protein [Lacibacter sp.]